MSRAADRMHAALTYASDETVHDLYRKYANDETVHDLYRNSGSASLSVYWRAPVQVASSTSLRRTTALPIRQSASW